LVGRKKCKYTRRVEWRDMERARKSETLPPQRGEKVRDSLAVEKGARDKSAYLVGLVALGRSEEAKMISGNRALARGRRCCSVKFGGEISETTTLGGSNGRSEAVIKEGGLSAY